MPLQGQEDRTLVEEVLKMATEETDNPDLRDRAYIYWRLLTQNAEAANAIVLVKKPVIADDTEVLDPGLLAQLMSQLSTLASTYHKPPEAFVKQRARATGEEFDDDADDEDYGASGGGGGEAMGGGGGGGVNDDDDDDILGMGMGAGGGGGGGAAAGGGGGGGNDDLLDLMGMGGGGGVGGSSSGGGAAPVAFPEVPKSRFQTAKPAGFAMQGVLVPSTAPGKLDLRIEFANMQMPQAQQRFQLQFNKNFAGIVPDAAAISLPQPLQQGGRGGTVVPCHIDAGGAKQTLNIATAGQPLQAAIKDDANGAVAYFTIPPTYASLACCGLAAGAGEGGKMERKEFLTQWKSLPNEQEIKRRVEMAAGTQLGVAQIIAKMVGRFVLADWEQERRRDRQRGREGLGVLNSPMKIIPTIQPTISTNKQTNKQTTTIRTAGGRQHLRRRRQKGQCRTGLLLPLVLPTRPLPRHARGQPCRWHAV